MKIFYEKLSEITEQLFLDYKRNRKLSKDSAGFCQDRREGHSPEEFGITEQ